MVESLLAVIVSVSATTFIVQVGGLPNEVVHRSAVDLGCRGVIDERNGCAVVVGDGLAGGCLHVFTDFGTAVGIAEHVDVAVVEAGEDDDFGVHHGGDEFCVL